MKNKAYLGVDIGSISTKGVIIDGENNIIAKDYIWTKGDPIGAVKVLLKNLKKQLKDDYVVVGAGTTGSARRLIGIMIGASVIKNEITAHAIGTSSIYKDVKTIFEIGGQDSKIILLDNGIVTDEYYMCRGYWSFFIESSKKIRNRYKGFWENCTYF